MDHDVVSEFPDASSIAKIPHDPADGSLDIHWLVMPDGQWVPRRESLDDHDVVDRMLEEAELRAEALQNDILLTIRDMAFLCGFKPGTVKAYLEQGKIPGFKLGDQWRCSLRYFRQWVGERSGSNLSPTFCVHGIAGPHWTEDLTIRCLGPS